MDEQWELLKQHINDEIQTCEDIGDDNAAEIYRSIMLYMQELET